MIEPPSPSTSSDSTNIPTIETIKMKLNKTLEQCLPMFGIGKNVEASIRKKMLGIIKANKDIGKLKNEEVIIFSLLIHAIRELKIPLNKKRLNEKIKNYMAMNLILKDLKDLQI
jgi:hypothetical protein